MFNVRRDLAFLWCHLFVILRGKAVTLSLQNRGLWNLSVKKKIIININTEKEKQASEGMRVYRCYSISDNGN